MPSNYDDGRTGSRLGEKGSSQNEGEKYDTIMQFTVRMNLSSGALPRDEKGKWQVCENWSEENLAKTWEQAVHVIDASFGYDSIPGSGSLVGWQRTEIRFQ